MADQSIINKKSYVGFQPNGLGFSAVADKQFPNIAVVPSPSGSMRPIETVGEEYPTSSQHGTIDSDIVITGSVIDFVAVNYALEMFYGTVTPTTVGVTGKKRIYTATSAAPRYFTNDYGDSTRFQRAIDCFATGLHFHATLNETVFDGKGKGQMILDNVLSTLTLAGSPTLVAQKTPDPLNSDLIIATSLAALDTTPPLTRGFVWDANIDDRWHPIHAMNSSLQGAYDAVIRKKPGTASGSIQLGSDDDGWAWLTRALANTTVYVRYAIYGQEIAAGTSEVQTITLTGVSSGTFDLTLPMFGSKTLLLVPYNITAAALKALINGLVYRGASAVNVTLAAAVYTVTFPTYLGNPAPMTTVSTNLIGGTAVVATPTPGVAPVNYLFQADMAVSNSGFPKPGDMEGLDVLDISLWLMKTSTLNGIQFTTINETAVL